MKSFVMAPLSLTFLEKLDREEETEKETEKLIKNSARDLFGKKSMIEVQRAWECLGACLYLDEASSMGFLSHPT